MTPKVTLESWNKRHGWASEGILADKVGTKQPSIARLENGSTVPSIRFLHKLLTAMDCHLVIKVKKNETKTDRED